MGALQAWSSTERPEAFNLPETLTRLRDPDPDAPDDPELRGLYHRDQEDRRDNQLADGAVERDILRRRRGMEKLAAGEVRSPWDYYHLAMLLQHSGLPEHYHLAHELCRRAAPHCPRAPWLAAAALDRWLLHMGLPQRFGTQYVRSGGRWSLYRVDPSTTDEERTTWDVPTLAEAHHQAEKMNHSENR
ncbi:hypothetical protein [Sphaerisporangium aureirubrum]|uniref:Uncharacterized protein n=1 Tax=Sphaerisporangium aureirubrum TaxID=1544736 RepID=A0ABW1NS16_9ACTN